MNFSFCRQRGGRRQLRRLTWCLYTYSKVGGRKLVTGGDNRGGGGVRVECVNIGEEGAHDGGHP